MPDRTLAGQLEPALAGVVPALITASDALLVASDRMLATPTGWPSWLLLRTVRFGCRCRINADAGSSTLFWILNAPASVRELLTADLSLEFAPLPHDADEPRDQSAPPSLQWPAPFVAGIVERGLQSRLPAGSDPARSLLVQMGPDEYYGFGVAQGTAADFPPAEIAVRWTHGETVIDERAGKDADWRLEPFLRLVLALAARSPSPSGAALAFPERLPESPLWQFYRELADTTASVSRQLEELWRGSSPANIPENRRGLRTRWALRTFEARVTPLLLVDERTQDILLAKAGDADSFTAPFRLVARPWGGASLALLLPDFVATGSVRQALLDAFRGAELEDGAPRFPAAYEALEDAADNAEVPREIVRRWLEGKAEHAAVIRIDRRANNDEMMLLVAGEHSGRPVGLYVWMDKVVWNEAGNLERIRGRRAADGGDLGTFLVKRRDGKQALGDFLHGLLRWRAALRL